MKERNIYIDKEAGIYFENHKGYLVNKNTLQYLHREIFPDLPSNIEIHHVDGNKYNNSKYNLLPLTKRQHQFLHKGKKTAENILKLICDELIDSNSIEVA